ncbi:hypothetical protein CS063_00155 [Sporanaerobium hydrogeniformans]|uniref:Uncharacterized protein n=1 Tax=Sporanaerobium hydrogeniformans TaxID=3072179 RepID=A0AC61DFA3_9FIRM|nr:hypothetical protein [Sporanaerobium hydrogeniformans]PHV71929.1 hypothetical protein CS063_00155 [Sporanaerobium hydrogeniformans]
MLHTVICLKSYASESIVLKKIYKTALPLAIVRELALIEKRDWVLFRDSSYSTFGHFIYHYLPHYPILKNYINKSNSNFEFIYEFITDQSYLDATLCYAHGQRISFKSYKKSVHKKAFHERWLMIDGVTQHTLIFFDYDFNPIHYSTSF